MAIERFKPLLLGLLLLSGCAGEPFRLEVPAHHPASPLAPEAPLPPPSSALAEEGPALEPAPEKAAPMSGGHSGHGGHGGMHH